MACDLAPRLGTLKAAVSLHALMLWAVCRAPLLFFDTTPIGRVLSRFSKDIDALDATLPELISDGIYCFFEVTNLSINHACICTFLFLFHRCYKCKNYRHVFT